MAPPLETAAPDVCRFRAGCELGLDLCALLFLPILVLVSRGAAPLAAVAGLCALGLAASRGAAAWRRVRGLALLFTALAAWGLLSAAWAVEPQRSVLIAARLAGMFAAGLAMTAAADEIAAPARTAFCVAAGFALALVLAVAQVATNGALTAPLHHREFLDSALNHAENGFGFLGLPLCAMLLLQRRRFLAAAVALATMAAMIVLVGDTARAAFIAGIVAAALIYARRVWLTRDAAIVSAVLILAAPVIFPSLDAIGPVRVAAQHFKNSVWHRLEIWSFVGARIADKPVLGWGLDSSRAIPGGNTPIQGGYPGQVSLPLHPHNAPLQVWLELGLPGALLFAALVAWAWLALGRTAWPPLYAAAAGGSLAAALVVALGSYGVWQEWLISSEFLSLFLIMVMARAARSEPSNL